MNRKIFDMNQCRPGDCLVMKNGNKAIYKKKKVEDEIFGEYFHHVTYRDDCGRDFIGTRTDEGWFFETSIACDGDVVGFWED